MSAAASWRVSAFERRDAERAGLLAGRVHVVGEDDLLGRVADEEGHLARRERGAERRHHVREAGLVGHERVGVALDDHGRAGLADLRLRPVEEVERPALVEQGRRRRVQVLRAVGVAAVGPAQDAPAETGRVAGGVADREDDPRPEAVVDAVAALAGRRQADLDEVGRADLAALLERPAQGVPVGRRPAEVRPFDRLVAEAALAQVGEGALSRGALRQDGVVERDRGLDDVVETPAAGVLPCRPLVDLDACTRRQEAERLRKGEPVAAHDEAEDVPSLAAAEAVPALAARRDDEARRLLAVERAEALVGRARLLQLDRLPDDVEDGQPALHFGGDADGQAVLLRGGCAARCAVMPPRSPVRPCSARSPSRHPTGRAHGRVKS